MDDRRGSRGWSILHHRLTSSCILLLAMFAINSVADWLPATPDYAWHFPRDHWAHPGYKTEWWYVTGHLTPAGGGAPRFGYQFTFFRVGLLPEAPGTRGNWAARDLVMGHAALTDLRTGTHRFSELVYRAGPLLGEFTTWPDTPLVWSRAPVGTGGRWSLGRDGPGFAFTMRDAREGFGFTLATVPRKPRVFQGPNGYSRKGDSPDAASLYYSFTRLDTRGVLVLDGDTLAVTGTSWMDREFGSNQLDPEQTGWDWFSLQLDDGREVMLYLLRDAAGRTDFARGTLVGADGTARILEPGDWRVEVLDRWESPVSGAVYPARWRIRLPGAGLALTVVPEVPASENVSTLLDGLRYWEGPVRLENADGRPVGRGYVELTGYGEAARLPL